MEQHAVRKILADSGCFLDEWYLENYPEVAQLRVDPLDDYLSGGAEAGRKPNPFFDDDFYRKQNPGLPAGMLPLLHYCTEGWKAFRSPGPGFNAWWYRINYMGAGDETLSPLAHYLRYGQQNNSLPTLAEEKKLSVKEKSIFNTRSIALFESLPLTASLVASIAAATEDICQYDLADMFAGKACELEPQNADRHMQLARVLLKRNGWARLLSVTGTSIQLDVSNAESFFLHGLANEKLERYEAAAEAYRRAVELNPQADVEWYYRLGSCEEVLGDEDRANLAYEEVERRSDDLPIGLGVGILHEQAEAWDRAAKAYAARIERDGASAPLYYRYGLMLDFCYRWEEAEHAYRQSLGLVSDNAECLYRLGQVLERLERYSESAQIYAVACAASDIPQPDWRYRQGHVAWRAGCLREACEAWVMALSPVAEIECAGSASQAELQASLAQSRQDSDVHFRLGLIYESKGLLREAADAFTEAAARRDDYSPWDYYHLGRVLITLGEYREACMALSEIREVKRPFALPVTTDKYDIKQIYAEHLATLDVRPDVVLYESFHGASISCNPYALFRYLLAQQEHAQRLHVWVVKSPESIPQRYCAMRNVIFVRHGSSLYLRYLATAGYLINNNSFFPYFLRRPEQKYLNTWHGTPLKTLGVDVPSAPFEHKNVVRNILQCTHLIYPNRHTRDTFLRAYQADDLYNGKLANTGYPRIDLMLNADARRRQQLRAELAIDNERPVALYAPTWRGSATPEMDIEHLMADLEQLSGYPINLVVSAHHLLYDVLKQSTLPVILLRSGIDTTEFLSVVDVLITDYSSVMFDYLPLRRPIILYAHDLDTYKVERGLYFDMQVMPGVLCTSREALVQALSTLLEAKGEAMLDMAEACAEFCPKEDGQASARVVKFLFEDVPGDESPNANDGRLKLLFYAGALIPNGVTAAFLRLVSLLPEEKYSVSLAVDPWVMESYPQRMQRFSELPAHVKVLGRVSFPVGSREEEGLNSWFQRCLGQVAPRVRELLSGFYEREYSRLYGCANFDVVLDFCGYTFHWTALLALGRPASTPGAMWLHNDMQAETKTRFPYLKSILSVANGFDRLVSVSADVYTVNTRTLVHDYGVELGKLCYVRNCIDPAWLWKKAAEPLDESLRDWVEGRVLIGSIGRLSREKAQDRIIMAFAQLHEHYPAARLVIAGQGPEKGALSELIAQLGLEESVRLLGYVENPYPLFKRLDLFVLPSDYEGQGIVLLEALALGRPVIATDIPGPREILQEMGGLLVEPSLEGIRSGIERFLQNRLEIVEFDADAYVRSAGQEFNNVIAGIWPAKESSSPEVETVPESCAMSPECL
ncbi:CDP-glycerol glycerophosphotransferase family protein [Stutzerimonas stutzeri]|uniref:CDP-glycerol glycerophosphotransferase family protein n=1 Tax=Stutzerimonas stutzeri TaxID=316 RepID=UPI000F7B8DEC|nr:CDP-glycerol glycerophosphotransferase family protein [Stutzerimonas stutzeri]RRV80968.1 glycosyltransferase [Stutzerimonas stutzeri]